MTPRSSTNRRVLRHRVSGRRSTRSTTRILVVPLLWALLVSGCSTSVKPGINERFLSPDLDIDWAVNTFESESREIFTHRRQIVERLELSPATVVADVGAGTGLFLGLLADEVGPSGKVYAVDIAPALVEYMEQRIGQAGWTQVEARQGNERSLPLPADSVDLVFICDTYHHFEYPGPMLASIHRALRRGGRLVVVDLSRVEGESDDWTLKHVRAGKDVVTAEIEAAGFTLIDEPEVEGLRRNYMLRFSRD